MPPICDSLIQSVVSGNAASVRKEVRHLLDSGIEPMDVLTDGLFLAMERVNKLFQQNELRVTDLLVICRAMNTAISEISPSIANVSIFENGRVVIGTVTGDFHDIGKNIVRLILEISGFEVIDLGVSVSAADFVKEVIRHKPNVVCLSALLWTSIPSMEKTIKALRENGLRSNVKVVIGGSILSSNIAKKIGADAYAPNAFTAVPIIKKLISCGDLFTNALLEKVVSTKNFRAMQLLFYNMFGLFLAVRNPEGKLFASPGEFYKRQMQRFTCHTHLSNKPRDCHNMSHLPLEQDFEGVLAYYCSGNLIEIEYPLINQGSNIGAIICGHFAIRGERLPKKFYLEDIPILSRQRVDALCCLLSFTGSHMAKHKVAISSIRLGYLLNLISGNLPRETINMRNTGLIDRVLLYARKNYYRDLSLEAVAKQFFLSPCYLSRMFKQIKECNFSDYLLNVRIEEAKKLLLTSEWPVFKVGESVGYTNPQYFSQVFKRIVGFTPTNFRRQMSNRREVQNAP
jgi:hypothetical protein